MLSTGAGLVGKRDVRKMAGTEFVKKICLFDVGSKFRQETEDFLAYFRCNKCINGNKIFIQILHKQKHRQTDQEVMVTVYWDNYEINS